MLDILLVDDDVGVLHALSAMMPAGAQVRVAVSASEALSCLADATPDLVFLDANMPQQSGLELLAQLRQEPGPYLRVVMLTAVADPAIEASARLLGVADFLLKSVSAAQVQRTVAAVMAQPLAQRPVARQGLAEQPTRLLVLDNQPDRFEQVLNDSSLALGWLQFAGQHAEVLKCAWRDLPDLVLLNADTPGLNAELLLRALQADPGLRHIPVLVFTRSVEAADEVRWLDAGAADVVHQGTPSVVLRARIRRLVRDKRQSERRLQALRGSPPPPPLTAPPAAQA